MMIPDYVENEAAYADAIVRNIARNAMKTTQKRLSSDPEFAKLYAYVERKSNSGSKFFKDMWKAFEQRGRITENQEAAIAKIMREEDAKKAEYAKRDAGSLHVGIVGERREFTLTVQTIMVMESEYFPTSYLHICKDTDGNVLIYKGSKQLATERGAVISFKATIKAHDERMGVKQTKLARPALIVA